MLEHKPTDEDWLTCPLSLARFKNPVIAADGYTYEKECIEDWFRRGNKTSPITSVPLAYLDLIPNWNLIWAMKAWDESRPQEAKLQAEVEVWRKKYDEVKAKHNAQVEKVKSNIAKLRLEKENLKIAAETHKEEEEKLRGEVSHLQGECERFEATLRGKKQRICELSKLAHEDNVALKKQCEELQTTLSRKEQSYKEVKMLLDSMSPLEEKLPQLKQENADLSSKLQLAHEKNVALQAQCAQQEKDVMSLANVFQLEQENAALKQEKAELESMVDALKIQIGTLHEDYGVQKAALVKQRDENMQKIYEMEFDFSTKQNALVAMIRQLEQRRPSAGCPDFFPPPPPR